MYLRLPLFGCLFICAFLLTKVCESGEQPTSVQSPKGIPVPPKKAAKGRDPQAERKEKEEAARKELEFQKKLAADRAAQQSAYEKAQVDIQREISNFTGLLVIVGFLQIVVAWFTARVANNAAKSATQSANTADRQTGLIFQNERAWVVIKPKDPEPWPLPSEDMMEFPSVIEVPWTAKNVGRTPAFIKEISVNAEPMKMRLPDKHPPDPSPEPLPQFIIPPGDDHSGHEIIILHSNSEYRDIRESRYGIVFYGFIKYQDTLEYREHITRFCSYWLYMDSGNVHYFEPVGPPDWIEYT